MNVSPPSSSVVDPTTNIDALPHEILDRIFRHLVICDIGRCMMVSKRWHSVVSGFIIKELIIKGRDDKIYNIYSIYKKWCTNESFEQKMVVGKLDLSKPLSLNLTFLKRLAIYTHGSESFQLIQLNKFGQLEHLELNCFKKESQQDGITFLNLPHLKIVHCNGVDCKLVFNTPTLTEVYMSGSKDVRFRNLPTLKRLSYDSSFSNGNEYAYVFNRIKSVEVFRLNYNQNLHIMMDVLTHLNDVKEIRFDFSMPVNSINREYFDEWLTDVFEERRIQNKVHVKIFIFDILMEDGKAFHEYGFENVPRLHVRYN